MITIEVKTMNKRKMQATKKWLTMAIMLVVTMSSFVFIVSQPASVKEITIAGSSIIAPNSVNSELNLTISHLSYTTEPPQFFVNSSNYAQNATYTKGTGSFVTNATYQVIQYNGSASDTASAINYYMKGDTGNAAYYFSDLKFGLNGTGLASSGTIAQIIFGATSYKALVTPAAMPKGAGGETAANISTAESVGIDFNATATAGSTYTYNASMFYYYLASTGYVVNWTKFIIGPNGIAGTGSNPQALQALNMYELQVNMQATQQQVSLVYTNNGTVAQQTAVLTQSNAIKTPYLNFTKMDNASLIVNPTILTTTSSGFLFDWMYLVDRNSINYPSSSVVTAADALMAANPSGTGSLAAPFDPTSTAGQSSFQGANQSSGYASAKVNNNLFATVDNQSNPMNQNATGLNNSLAVSSLNTQFNASRAIVTSAFVNPVNVTVSSDTQINTWSDAYITSTLDSYLKVFAANQAEKNLKSYVSTNDITLISTRIGSIFVDVNYTPSAASTISTYLNNAYASILAKNNLAVVNPTTSAIVAGAYAGDFYSNGAAIVPMIHNGMIVNPVTEQEYTLQSAGFSAGAYISGGAVIVPQFQLLGWQLGQPLFVAPAGFSLGSIFGGLTSAGQAVSNMFHSAASTITNGIGAAAQVVDNNVVKPISTTVASPPFSAFSHDISSLANSAVGVFGLASGDLQKAITSNGITSAINSIKSTLVSGSTEAAAALQSGYNGIKTGIYAVGGAVSNGIKNATNGLSAATAALSNTAGKVISTTSAALSTLYTKMDNLISGSVGNIYSHIRGSVNTTVAALDSVGNTLTQATTNAGAVIAHTFTAAKNTLGNISSSIVNGLHGTISFIAGALPGVIHVLEYVGIGIVIVVIGIVLIMYFRGRSSVKIDVPGERRL